MLIPPKEALACWAKKRKWGGNPMMSYRDEFYLFVCVGSDRFETEMI
jgi:hypothetical protein